MGLCAAKGAQLTKEERAKQKQIEVLLRRDKKKYEEEQKLLLLGNIPFHSFIWLHTEEKKKLKWSETKWNEMKWNEKKNKNMPRIPCCLLCFHWSHSLC